MMKEDNRRHFACEFKRNAVQLLTEKGMSVGKVARELDIHPNLLHLWRRQVLKEGDRRAGYFKKNLGRLLQTKQMKYEFLEEHREAYKVRNMCTVLKVSRSGCYAWRDRLPSTRQRGSAELLQQIRQIHTQSRSLYGSPRITAELNEQGHRCEKIGLSMSDKLSQELASGALKDAVGRQRPPEGLIHHSDRGRQYASYAYQELLRGYGIVQSMSRSGNCHDNAYMESFFGTLKTELVHGERYRNRLEARLSIFEYVEVFYNCIRRHFRRDVLKSASLFCSSFQREILNSLVFS